MDQIDKGGNMSVETRRILDMLAEGKVSAEEAEQLLAALSGTGTDPRKEAPPVSPADKAGFRYLRVLVEPGPGVENGERVNIRVPLNLIRAGLKWASFIPRDARHKVSAAMQEKGIEFDFDRITPQDLEEILVHLNDLTVEVEGKEKVRVFCE
jgi:hypothetical protein